LENDHPLFDAQAILDAAHSVSVSGTWRVYRASRFYIIFWAVQPLVMALIFGFSLIFTLWAHLLSTGDLGLTILTGCQLAISVIVIPLFVATFIMQVRKLRASDHLLLVVTSEGFVQRNSNGRYGTLVVSFADQRYTPLRATFRRAGKRALLLPDERGQLAEWHPDPRFRPSGQIVEQILAAYASYTAERAHEQ
jgi:hypothetical protein